MKKIFGGLLRAALAVMLTAHTLMGPFDTELSTRWITHVVESNLPMFAVVAVPFAFFGWRTLFITWVLVYATMWVVPQLWLPRWIAVGIGLAVAGLVQLAWHLLQRRATAVQVRDQQGLHVELSVVRREGGHLLQLVTAKSKRELASAAPAVLPVGALKLSETPVMDDRLVVYPGFINTSTGYFSAGGSFTEKVDTGRRFIRIENEGGTVRPPGQLLDAEARRRPAKESPDSARSSIGFVVKKSEAARLRRWWNGHRRELMLGGKEAAQQALQARIAAQVAAARKVAKIDGVAEYRVDAEGRLSHYLEINRRGDVYLRAKGEEIRVQGPKGADLVLSLVNTGSAWSGSPTWDDGTSLPDACEVVKMARYVQQMR